MSDPTNQPVEPARSLTAFDEARDAFLAAFAAAPDAALSYLPPGDEYALGVLPMHLCDSMRHYLDTLDRIERSGYGPVDLSADEDLTEREQRRHRELVALRPTGADRQAMLDELHATHDHLCRRALAQDGASFERQAPVVYSAGSDPYPTSLRDVLGWLTDHYQEHVEQTQSLLEGWRASGGHQPLPHDGNDDDHERLVTSERS